MTAPRGDAPLPLKAAADVAAAAATSLVISPVVAMFDRAITENASGRARLLPSLLNSARGFAAAPVAFFRSPTFGWLWFVYACTYSAANLTDTACTAARVSPALPKVATTTLANTASGVMKARAASVERGAASGEKKRPPFRRYASGTTTHARTN